MARNQSLCVAMGCFVISQEVVVYCFSDARLLFQRERPNIMDLPSLDQ